MAIAFGEFVLDPEQHALFNEGREVHLSPRAFRLLQLLIERRPEALSRAFLYDALWPGTFVAETNLTGVVNEVRSALSDNARRPRFIRTVHRFGYAFRGDADPREESRAPTGPVLLWRNGVIALAPGQTVLGRDASADVALHDSTVSRRHVAITVDDSRITIRDLGSKNGTFVNGVRLTGETDLHDLDAIGLAKVQLELRWSDTISTASLPSAVRA